MPNSKTPYKYQAFISYSHHDTEWAKWIHKELEKYRVPKKVGKEKNSIEVTPRRLYPIYRDRDEAAASGNLGKEIENSLSKSAYLIVICSLHSAKSQWVNEEILFFKRIGRADYILPFIIDGEPNGTNKKGKKDQECYPLALRIGIDPEGNLNESYYQEPAAADARIVGDGKNNAILKLRAGLLAVGFESLKQREVIRRHQKLALFSLLLTVLFVAGAISYKTVRDKENERLQQESQALLERSRIELKEGKAKDAIKNALQSLNISDKLNVTNNVAGYNLQRALDKNRLIVELTGHSADVDHVEFRKDDKFLISTASLNELYVWDTKSWGKIKILNLKALNWAYFRRQEAGIVTLEWRYEEDDKSISRLKFFDDVTGNLLNEKVYSGWQPPYFPYKRNELYSPFFVLTNRYNQINIEPYVARIFLTETGEKKFDIPLDLNIDEPQFAIFPEADRLLIIYEKTVKIASLATGKVLGTLEGLNGKLIRPLFLKNQHLLFGKIFIDGKYSLGYWNIENGKLVQFFSNHNYDALSVFTDNNGHMLYGNWSEKPNEFMPSAISKTDKMPGRGRIDYGLTNAQSNVIVSGLRYGSVVIKYDELGIQQYLKPFTENVRSMSLSRDGSFLATGNSAQTIQVWDINLDIQVVESMKEHILREFKYDPISKQIASRTDVDRIEILDSTNGKLATVVSGFSDAKEVIWQWNPKEKLIMTESSENVYSLTYVPRHIRFFDSDSGKMLIKVDEASSPLVSPSWKVVLIDSQKKGFQFYFPRQKSISALIYSERLSSLEYGTTKLFTPDEKQLAIASGDGILEFRDVMTGKIIRTLKVFEPEYDTSVNSLLLSPSGQWALVSPGGGSTFIVDLETENIDEITRKQFQPTSKIGFYNEESILVSNGEYGKIDFWSFPSMEKLYSILGNLNPEKIKYFSDNTLIAEGDYGEVVVARSDTGDVLRKYKNVVAIHLEKRILAETEDDKLRFHNLKMNEIIREFPMDFVNYGTFTFNAKELYFTSRTNRLLKVSIQGKIEPLIKQAEKETQFYKSNGLAP